MGSLCAFLRGEKEKGNSFAVFRATGECVCIECLALDGRRFEIDGALLLEEALACGCDHEWYCAIYLNDLVFDEHENAKRHIGLSHSLRPCADVCAPELFSLAVESIRANAAYRIESDRINAIILGPKRDDIPPDEVLYQHNVRQSEAEPLIAARKRASRARSAVWRYVENVVRDARGLPHVGEGWVNETALFRVVQSLFPDDVVVHHYRAAWLGRLELDVYVKGANIGFEYQGIQHYKPQAHWGGDAALARGRERDAEKAQRCAENGTRLIEVTYLEEVSEETVRWKLGGDCNAGL